MSSSNRGTASPALSESAGLMLSRGDRARKFGIDCVDVLSWRAGAWDPGGEYVQKLVIKNVSTTTVKIKYQIPATKFFSMEFPKLMTLSPGMFVAVDVLFRPIRYEPYDDVILFRTAAGEFGVRVQSFISTLKVAVPPKVDLGFCPTGEVTRHTVKVRNVGQMEASFRWTHGPPFTLTPLSGTIAPGKSANIEIAFAPTDASVFVASAVCTVPGHDPMLMKMSAIGKYPYISSSDSSLDFEEVLVDAPGKGYVEKEFELRNQSLVRATFDIVAAESDHDPLFRFYPTGGCIEPESHVMVRVRYTAMAARSFTCDNFDIVTPGGNTVRINCRALAKGPVVEVAKKEAPKRDHDDDEEEAGPPRPVDRPTSLTFGDVKIGSVVSRVVYLTNKSEVPVSFQFIVEDKGTFQFDRTYGVVPPKLQSYVIIRFDPEVSGNFCRRIFCLFKDQMPIAIDCVGTAYKDLSRRPAPLTLRQMDAHRRRQAEGKGVLSPAELEALFQSREREDLFDLEIVNPSSCGGSKTRLTRSGEASEQEIAPMHTFFKPQCGVGNEITMDATHLDFGACSRHRPSERKTITVRNNTHGKVSCMWRIPLSDDDDDELDFEVIPECADISPGQTYTFRVVFRPSQDDFYYNQEIEAYVFFKSNRNFRLVNDDTLVPPWCLTCRVFGHTFGGNSEQFIPTMKCSATNSNPGADTESLVTFPPCHLGDAVYQTIKLTNMGDTPTEYSFEDDPSGIFEAKPRLGVVEAGGFALVALRFKPRGDRPGWSETTMRCLYNNNSLECLKLKLSGQSYLPALTMENASSNGGLYFKPTSTGIVSERKLSLRNTARVPVVFRWEIPAALARVVTVYPIAGRLQGNEVLSTTWTFAPKAQREYRNAAQLVLRSLGGMASAKRAKRVSVPVVGLGSTGAVRFDPPEMDMGTTLVGAQTTKILMLSNTSDCDLHFRVDSIRSADLKLIDQDGDGDIDISEVRAYAKMRRELADDGDGEVTAEELAELEAAGIIGFDPPIGLLPARSRAPLKVTYRPTLPEKNSFRVFCDVIVAEEGRSQEDIDWDAALKEKEEARAAEGGDADGPLFCDVMGQAAYPTMKISDARSALLAPDDLWKQFSLRALNYELSTPLSPDQLRLNRATGVGEGADDFSSLLKDFDFTFTPRPQGSPTEVVLLEVANVSNLPVRFRFKFPNELDIELEQWADVGEPTELQLRQNSIIDQRLFELEPRSGELSPGETVILRMSYSYNCLDFGGDHVVPITMKLDKGKQLKLWLRGRTLPRGYGRLFLPSPLVTSLKPTRIGHEAPPTQMVQIRNPSDVDIEYRIDLSPLEQLRRDNYDFPVMRCSNDDQVDAEGYFEGFIPGGSSASLPLTFQPLEALKYRTALEIQYRGANGEMCATATADGSSGAVSAEVASTTLFLEARGFDPTPVEEEEKKEDEHAHLSAEERLAMAANNLATRPKAENVEHVESDPNRAEAAEFGPPDVQSLMWPGVLSALSVDSINYGSVPSGSVVYRMTTIRNHVSMNPTAELEFEWDREHPLIQSGALRVYPASGRIAPGSLAVCKLTFRPGFDPEVIDTVVSCRCVLINNEQQGGRRGRRRRGTTAGSRKSGVNATGSVASTQQSVGGRGATAGSHVSVARRSTTASRGGKPEMAPPMASSVRAGGSRAGSTRGPGGRLNSAGSVSSQMTGVGEGTGMGPTMLLFAHVQAQVMRPDMFRLENAETRRAAEKFYMPKRDDAGDNVGPSINMLNPEDGSAGAAKNTAAKMVKDLASDVMTQLVEDLMDDPFVGHLVEDLPKAKIPFFVQLADMGPTPPKFGVMEASSAGSSSKTPEGKSDGDVGAAVPTEAKHKLLRSSECQDLVSRILENTFFNLISEVAHGEINLDVEPRRLVRSNNAECEN